MTGATVNPANEVSHGDILHRVGVLEGRLEGARQSLDGMARSIVQNREEVRQEIESIRTAIDGALENHKAAMATLVSTQTERLNSTENRLTLVLGGLILIGALLPFAFKVLERYVLHSDSPPPAIHAPVNGHGR